MAQLQGLVDSGNTAGGDAAYCVSAQLQAMLYDTFYVQLTAAGTGNLALWISAGARYRLAQRVPVVVPAGPQALAVRMLVPAGALVSYERLTGGYCAAQGFSAPQKHNRTLPSGAALGDTAAATPTSLNYAVGASGFAVEEAPAQARAVRERQANATRFPAPKQYIVGTFLPRAGELATWQGRGINTIFTGEADFAQTGEGNLFETTWKALNLNIVRRVGRAAQPGWTALDDMAQAQADALDPRVLAWLLPDEPDNLGHPDQPGYQGAFDPAVTRFYMDREIATLRTVSQTKPIFMNLRGYNVSIAQAQYPGWYLDDPGVNWWGTDQYPNTSGGQPNGFLMFRSDLSERYVSTAIGMAADMAIQQDYDFGDRNRPAGSIGKPYLFHLATGRVINGDVAEQAGRWRALAWSGIIHGACGHIYFPQRVADGAGNGGYISDDSTTELLAEMAVLHAKLAILNGQSALIDPVYGGRVSYRVRRCAYAPVDAGNQAAAFAPPRDDQLPGPFEGCEVYLANGDTLRLVLNLKSSAQALADASWGYAGLAFGAYEVKAFLASAPAVNLFA